MMTRKYELLQTALSAVVIVVASMVNSLPVAIALAAVVLLAGLGHVALAWRRERICRAHLEEEQKNMRWSLVPGPGA
jgi:hypothetical protein